MRSKRSSEGMYDTEMPIRSPEQLIPELDLKEYKKIATIQDTLKGMSTMEGPMLEFIKTCHEVTKAFAIQLAIKLNLFIILKDGPMKASEIAKKAGVKIPVRQFMSILDKLVIHNYLNMEGVMYDAQYSNSNFVDKYFTSYDEENYLCIFDNLDRYFKKILVSHENILNGNITNIFDDLYQNEEYTRDFVDYFYKLNKTNFAFLLDSFDFSSFKRVTDIRCANGELISLIKKIYPDLEVTGFDTPLVQVLTRQHVQKRDVDVNLIFGDLMEDDIPISNVIIAPHVIQYFFVDNKRFLLSKIYDSLEQGGFLIILENLLNPTILQETPAKSVSFLLTMENYEGYNMTYEEYDNMLFEIGFKDLKHNKMDGTSSLLFARK